MVKSGPLRSVIYAHIKQVGSVTLLFTIVGTSAIFMLEGAPSTPFSPSSNTRNPDRPAFQSAETCRSCHAQIVDEWKASWMAKSYTNPVFQMDYERYKIFSKDKPHLNSTSCLRCHAPIAVLTNDLEVITPLSREGVSCDVCHSVAAVKTQDDKAVLVFDPRGIKYGPNKEPKQTTFHDNSYSEAIRSAALCGACHFDADAKGMPLEWTYKEWRESAYAQEGIRCQDCHMRLKEENQASEFDGSIKQPMSSHKFDGGHSTSSLLKGAVTLNILFNKGAIQVEVRNSSVGHNFPTKGAHPNQLILTLSAKDGKGGEVYREKRIYGLLTLNAQGKLAGESEEVSSVQDTTLKPLETRTETFTFPSIKKTRKLEAMLQYYFIPEWLGKQIDPTEYQMHYRPIVINQTALSLKT
jgi:hypothetical protein